MEIETVVVGAGFVGLAIGVELSSRGEEVLIIEQHPSIGAETSSRNSEVLHSGLYYPKQWLKTQLCLEGKKRLLGFCLENEIPVLRCGKLIVSTSENDIAQLKKLQCRATENGIDDVEWLDAKQAYELEPQLSCFGALYCPSTSVIDSNALFIALQNSYLRNNGILSLQTKLENIEILNNRRFRLSTTTLSKKGVNTVTCKNLILATGLYASKTASTLKPYLKTPIPETYFAKGYYYYLKKENPFSHLIYPLPSNEGLGIHYTLPLRGQPKFGPDVEWSTTPSVEFHYPDEKRLHRFTSSIRKYWPDIREEMLEPGYVGVRPRLYSAGQTPADFAIHGPKQHGLSNLILLFGIESPGLTSCLGIGSYVANLLENKKLL